MSKDGFETEVVRHIETTLARSLFNCDELYVYLTLGRCDLLSWMQCSICGNRFSIP